ncbi:MAG: fibronectin type III domain-containing protein, partial [Marinilabilia sp.]
GTMASPEDGSSFVSVKEIDLLDLGSEWNDIAMLFEEIPETHNYIALKIISPADNSLSFAMDEVEIDEVSGSPAPGNLRVDEIKDSSSFISWDEFGAASEWEVSIGQPGFDPEEEGTSFSTENNAFELVDLEPETYYDFYVRSIGPDGNTSEWTGPTSFITEEKCPAPENLNIEEVSETSAELSWDETGDAALWNIEWGDFGFEEGEGTLVEDLTETSYLFEDLNKNTWYQFNVSSNCEEDGGSDIISGTYSAGCDGNMAEIPYSTDFTNTPGSQMPVCWLAPSEETTNYDQVVEVEEYNASLLMMNYGNAFTDVDNSVFAALPELNATLTDLSVSFSAFKSSWLNGDVILQVGVYTPAGEFIPHEEFLIDQTNSDHLTEHVVYFDDYSGDTDGRIAFYLADKESNQHRVNIDQVTVEEIPVCRKPSRLTIDAIAYDEVELTWQENGDAQKWEVVYGPEGFDPDEEGETLMPEETSFAVLSGLEANTDYEVYVRSECSDGGFSDWSMPGGFTSWCQPLQVQLTNVDEGGQVNVTDEFELLCDVSFSCVDKNVQVYLENTDTGEEYKIDDLSEEDYENELSCTLNNFIPSGNYRVRFEYNEFSWNDDHDVREVYTHEFEIVNGKEKLLSLESPQSGAILYYEYEMLIRWNSLGVEKVRIEYTLDNGETWSTYQEIESSGGYSKGGHNSIYRKAAREMVGESVKIRLSDVSNPEINVESGSFSVVRNMPFSLISPSEEMMEVSREEGFEMVFEMTVPGSVFYYPVTEEEDLTENRVKIDASEGENTYLVETADLPDGVYSLFIHGLDQQWNYDDFPDFEIVTDTSIDWFKDDGRDNEIMVYPNPVKNQLFLSAEKAGSEIPAVLYDMSGRAVREGFVNGRPINMTGMKPGVYFLVINGETHKIVKE